MRIAACAGGVLAVGFLSGCKDRRIESYEIAKEFVPSAVAGHAAHAHDEAASPLSWEAPVHWKSKPPSAMRYATFGVPMADGTEADLSVTVLGGDAGGLPANVNRWRAQLGLTELGADSIARAGETIAATGVTFTLFDLAGKMSGGEARMLAAVAEFEGQSWFFKLSGHDHCVGVEKPEFVAFLRSVKAR